MPICKASLAVSPKVSSNKLDPLRRQARPRVNNELHPDSTPATDGPPRPDQRAVPNNTEQKEEAVRV